MTNDALHKSRTRAAAKKADAAVVAHERAQVEEAAASFLELWHQIVRGSANPTLNGIGQTRRD